jgi:hypothetical protein
MEANCLVLATCLFVAIPHEIQQPESDTVRAPAFGVSVSAPKGWERVYERRDTFVIGWTKRDNAIAPPSCAIVVEMEPTSESDLKKIAERTAKRVGGKLIDESISLDGKPAILIKAVGTAPNMRMVDGVICLREGLIYKLGAFARNPNETEAAVREMRQSWKWTPLLSSADTIRDEVRPYKLRGMPLIVKLPGAMRELPAEGPGKSKLFLYDARTHVLSFVMDVSSSHKPRELSMHLLRDRFGAAVVNKMKLPNKLAWESTGGAQAGYLCRTFEPPAGKQEGEYKGLARYGIVKISDDTIGLFSFSFSGRYPSDQMEYEKLAEAIMASVEIDRPHK